MGFTRSDVILSFGRVVAIDELDREIRECKTFSFSDNRFFRLLKYFWIEDFSGKACMIYGLFRTDFLLQRKSFAEFNAHDFSDMLFVFSCLGGGSVHIDPSVVFYKRAPVYRAASTSMMARISNSVFTKGLLNYYLGYVVESRHVLDKLVIFFFTSAQICERNDF